MSILIKGMEMPKGCSKCPLRFYEGQGVWVCCITGSLGYDDDEEFKPWKQRGKDCPLVGLPSHGSTNADRIKTMPAEELAEVISNLGNCDTCYLYHRGCSMNISCKDAILEWLKKESE